ncbi:leucine-rich repeat protein, partial [uncultured Campylobacter sp.]|uniref:leucine-rich repeat protein n=1 Tax=uncultured Campylobacter sp. TaxID=218934 RepID=UPI0026244195
VNTARLNLNSSVEDGALAANSTVLFSENGSELVRKASVSKLKELVQTEVDLSEYIKKTDADTNYLGASATASDSEKLGGVEAEKYLTKTVADSTYSLKGEAPGQGAVQISGQELNLDQSGTNFIVNGNFYLDIVASDSSVGKSGHIALLNMTENFSFGGDCIMHGIRPKGSDVLLSYFVQSPTKIYLSYLPENSNAVSEELVETTNGVKTVVLPKTATEIPPGIYSQKLLRSQIIEGANIKKLHHNQFNSHNTITSISFPALKETEVHCFYNCPNLSSVFVPSIEKIKSGAFSQIGAKELFLPRLKTIEQNGSCLKENPRLETLVIPNATFAVYNHIGYSCPNLKKVVCKRGMADVIKQILYNLNQSYMINRIEFVEM